MRKIHKEAQSKNDTNVARKEERKSTNEKKKENSAGKAIKGGEDGIKLKNPAKYLLVYSFSKMSERVIK